MADNIITFLNHISVKFIDKMHRLNNDSKFYSTKKGEGFLQNIIEINQRGEEANIRSICFYW